MSIPDPVTTGVVLAGALQIAKQGQEFIAAAHGHPGESIGTILGNAAQRRVHNAEAVANKAHLILLNIGETPQEVPLNVIQPLLEAASLQEDSSLQDTWANLLANSADPRQINPVSPTFAGILKELTARDVRFIDAVYNEALKMRGTYQLNEVRLSIDDLLNTYATAGLSRRENLTMVTVQEAKDDITTFTADLDEFDFTLEVSLRNRVLNKTSVDHETRGCAGPEPSRDISDRKSHDARRLSRYRDLPLGFDARSRYLLRWRDKLDLFRHRD
jgi:hypothetical protein